MMSKTASSQPRRIGILVFLLTISLVEFTALILNYQNNLYLRQYVSNNLGATAVISVGLLVFAFGAAYLVSKKLGPTKSPGPHVPVFARIGSFVGRRYKLIIVFWILLLVASLPLSQQLSQVSLQALAEVNLAILCLQGPRTLWLKNFPIRRLTLA